MPAAARVTDTTSHASPLSAGPGSGNVFIGRLPAWRALPDGVGAGLEAASNAMNSLMSAPTLTPVSATADLARVQAGLTQSASSAAANGNPAAVGATASAMATLTTTNVSLTAAYVSGCAVPGGAPAATTAYTLGIQTAAAAAVSAAVSAIAGMTDLHNCPMPCAAAVHGPGVVTRGSKSVYINKLPATRQGDEVFEACGGSDAIAIGSPNVFIGDKGGTAASGGAASASSAGAIRDILNELRLVQAAGVIISQNRAAAVGGNALCEVCSNSAVGVDGPDVGGSVASSAGKASTGAAPSLASSPSTESSSGFGQSSESAGESGSTEDESVTSEYVLELAAHPAQTSPFSAYPLNESIEIGYRILFHDGSQQAGSFSYAQAVSVHRVGLTAWQGEQIERIEVWGEPYAHAALVDLTGNEPLAQGRLSTKVQEVYATPDGWLGSCRFEVLQGVAAFTADQMTRNLSDADVLECARLNAEDADSAEAQYRYGRMVHKNEGFLGFGQDVFFLGGGEGDFKPIVRPVWGTDNRLGDDPRIYYYDLWANLHFGYIGRAAGFSLQLLLDRASAFNLVDSGKPDPATDELAVRTGYWLHQRYPSGITVEQLADAIAEYHVYRRD